MRVDEDNKRQKMIEWDVYRENWRRAWILHQDDEKDYAGTGRYLCVSRADAPFAGPAGNPVHFPISSDLTDDEVLETFVRAVCEITGCKLKQAPPQSN